VTRTMSPSTNPIVAIVGSVNSNPDAERAAEILGRELALEGFRLLASSDDPHFLESRVVRGFIASNAAASRSIQVRYPVGMRTPDFSADFSADFSVDPGVFDFRPDPNKEWEFSFYRSLVEVDGVLLMGGGHSTFITGLVAISNAMPIVAVAAFGGYAARICELLKPERDLPTAQELAEMARPVWSEANATTLVRSLKDQIARKRRLQERGKLQDRIERTSADYIEDALKTLGARERRYQRVAYCWYALGILALTAGIGTSTYLTREAIPALPVLPSQGWPVFALVALKSVVIIGLLIAASKYSFALGKSYMSEALKNSDRGHAISFGKFYLNAYGEKATWPEIKEALQHWNIARESAFAALDSSEFDPKFLNAAIELAKAISGKGEGKK
jgi:hypothetical protein